MSESSARRHSILLIHGYLLHGTGSNLYVLNLARGLLEQGHNVYLMCQEDHASTLDCVNEVWEFDNSNQSMQLIDMKDTVNKYTGKCVCIKPIIGDLLPVYVYDHYDAFKQVKTFLDLNEPELAHYVECNVQAIVTATKQFKIDIIQTNHTVMLPYIAHKATATIQQETGIKIPYHATVHGSALNFTVKPSLRYAEYAILGLQNATSIVVDSVHANDELKEWLEEVKQHALAERVVLIPAGVDVSIFTVSTDPRSKAFLEFEGITKRKLQIKASSGRSCALNASMLNELAPEKHTTEKLVENVQNVRMSYDYRQIDQDIFDTIAQIVSADEADPVVFFVGKYLWTKGMHALIFALPDVLAVYPKARLIFSGFGPFREPAEILINALTQGQPGIDALNNIIKDSTLFHNDHDKKLVPHIDIFNAIIKRRPEWLGLCGNMKIGVNVFFTGIVDHEQLCALMPGVDVLVAPSVFPEAFGMVAIEAMACGVYPVVSYQSAFKEIADLVNPIAEKYSIGCVKCTLDEALPENIANCILGYLDFKGNTSPERLLEFRTELRQIVVDRFSWSGIAASFIETFEDAMK